MNWVWLWFRASSEGPTKVFSHIQNVYAPEELEIIEHPNEAYELIFKTNVENGTVYRSCTLESFPPLINLLLSNPSTGVGHQSREALDQYRKTYSQYRL